MTLKIYYLLSVISLTLLLSTPLGGFGQLRDHPRHPVNCPYLTNPKGRVCGKNATLHKPVPPSASHKVYDLHECLQRGVNGPHENYYTSIGFQVPEGPESLARCHLYNETVEAMGWRRNGSSDTIYYEPICFGYFPAASRLIVDGTFDSSDPGPSRWKPVKPGSRVGSGHVSFHQEISDSNYVGTIEEYANGLIDESGNNRAGFSRTYEYACPNSTYRIEFEEYVNQFRGIADFVITVGDVTVFTQNETTAEGEVRPIYFTTTKESMKIEFIIQGLIDDPHEITYGYMQLDDIHANIVYRSEVPKNATVYVV